MRVKALAATIDNEMTVIAAFSTVTEFLRRDSDSILVYPVC